VAVYSIHYILYYTCAVFDIINTQKLKQLFIIIVTAGIMNRTSTTNIMHGEIKIYNRAKVI